MSSKILKKENNMVTLEFTVSKDDFEKAVNKAYLKVKNNINIKGFRKGKAPRHIIEKIYGKSIFYDEALDIAVQEAYPAAVEELQLDIIDSPKIDVEKFEEGEDLVFKAEVEVMPEVELPQYKGVEVVKTDIKVTDDDIQRELKHIQDKNARIVEVTNRPVQKGDFVTIDYEGFVGEEKFEGGTAENQTLEIGSNSFIPGFEDQLTGKSKGEEVQVKVTFPEDYHAENLRGKEAVFNVKIHEIKAKELPELDDEFAKDVSEFDTLDELKEDIKKKKTEEAEHRALHEFEDSVIKKVVENAQVDIPHVMIDNQIESMIRDFDYQLRYQGLDLESYMKYMNINHEELHESYKDMALDRVKTQLVLEAITKAENIEVSDEELQSEIEKTAKQYNQEADKFKKSLRERDIEYIKDGLVIQKTIDFLVNNSINK